LNGKVIKIIKLIKPLVINFKGMTLSPIEGQLAVKKNKYELPDTPIGLYLSIYFLI